MILLNKKSLKNILFFLPIFLLSIELSLFIMVVVIYKTNPDYGFILSQKIRSHSYDLSEKQYNKEFNLNKNFGEFCYRFFGDELKTKKVRLSLNDKTIRGSVYSQANLYAAKVNPETLDLNIENNPTIWHWKWYNWIGIGLDKVHQQTLEEMVNSSFKNKGY